MTTRVCLQTTATEENHVLWVGEVVDIFTDYMKSPKSRYECVASPEDADVILFIEPPSHKMLAYAKQFAQNKVIRAFPEKCFAYDWEDGPVGLLAGVYPSMTRQTLAKYPQRCRTAGYVIPYDKLAKQVAQYKDIEPTLLFAFRGFHSAPIRRAILDADFGDAPVRIVETFRWLNHNPDEQFVYAKDMLEAKFVLCPRGVGTSSHRLFETLAVGRAPVILSDDWEPPAGPDWDTFSIRVPEADVRDLPRIVAKYEPQWREMGAAARAAYEEWFAIDVAPGIVLDLIQEIIAARPATYREAAYIAQWDRFGYAWQHGWTLPQGFYREMRAGNLVNKVRGRFQSAKR